MLISVYITIAVTVSSLEVVFNFLGAVGCNFIAILLPSTFYTILSKTIRHRKYDKRKRIFYYFIKGY